MRGQVLISKSPTKTANIEKAWLRDINRRWREFNNITLSRFVSMNKQINNAEVGFNAEQLRTYMAFLNQQIEVLLLGAEPPMNWQNQYQLESYVRGIERTRAELIRQGAELQPTPEEMAQGQGLTDFSARPSIGAVSTLPLIHQEDLEFIFTRSYESLKGWTDNLSKEVRQIIFDAAKQGDGVTETAKKIRERTMVSKSRAQTIARTETISAYREASIAETERASEEIGEEIGMRWITAQDSRVRHLHATWHGTIASPKETQRKGNISVYNCRCAQIPVIKGVNDTPEDNAVFKRERKQLMRLEETTKKS